jgi:hypothetical protein
MSIKPNPDPTDSAALNEATADALPLDGSNTDSNMNRVGDLLKQSAGSGTIKVNG